MPTNPKHGYLTEPKWFNTRNTIRELFSLRTWAEFATLAAVVVVIMVIFA